MASLATGEAARENGAWPLDRDPFALATSLPGVFAAGDVRAGSMSRVASAVGEGGLTVRMVHELFAAERLAPAAPLSPVQCRRPRLNSVGADLGRATTDLGKV